MPEQHPGAGVTHDRPGLFSLSWLVAVNRTVRASRLVLAIRTLLPPHFGVVQELPAFRTQVFPASSMMVGAIDADHPGHGQPLTHQVLLFQVHIEPVTGLDQQKTVPARFALR